MSTETKIGLIIGLGFIVCFAVLLANTEPEQISEAQWSHVVDAADPHVEDCVKAVLETLSEIGAGDLPMITVLNKVDIVQDTMEIQSLLNSVSDAVPISARTREGVDLLGRLGHPHRRAAAVHGHAHGPGQAQSQG